MYIIIDNAKYKSKQGVVVFLKRRIKQMLPAICIIGITAAISIGLYREVIEHEEERCWQLLDDTAQSVKKEITMKFEDEIVKLHLTADVMVQEDKMEAEQVRSLHLEKVQSTTIFSRIDVIYPDNTVLLENGTQKDYQSKLSFDDIVSKGEHISSRMTDEETGKECVYYYVPVVKDNETLAILTGVIDAGSLSEIFTPTLYNGQAEYCIVDSSDGNYIMDSWHKELGNAYDTPMRKRLKRYEDVDLKQEIKNQRTGVIAFESRTNGKALYMYYTPAGIFDWQLSIFAQEDTIFENVLYLKKLLLFAGIVEVVLLVWYFLWNLITMRRLEKGKAEIERQQERLKYLSYQDMLTSLYNRNKYIQVLDSCKEQVLKRTGVVYIDLNGLKQINDLQSHGEGDNFIRNTAKVISGIFSEQSYRIGGDEFVVLALDMDNEEFLNKIAEFKEILRKEQISVSIGFLWKESCNSLETMLKEAEEQMYKEKENYYQTHKRQYRS